MEALLVWGACGCVHIVFYYVLRGLSLVYSIVVESKITKRLRILLCITTYVFVYIRSKVSSI